MAKENEVALSRRAEVGQVRALQRQVETNSEVVDAIVNRLVSQYCQPLDDYMGLIREILNDENNPPTNEELDRFTLNLPVLLYFTGEAQESLGIRGDVAEAIKQELYNEAYNQAAGTIGDKTAAAELATQNEFIAQIGYQRAYKKIKLRMEMASEMLQSVKKVISRRMQEYDLSKVDDGRFSR